MWTEAGGSREQLKRLFVLCNDAPPRILCTFIFSADALLPTYMTRVAEAHQIMFHATPGNRKLGVFWERTYAVIAQNRTKTPNIALQSPPRSSGQRGCVPGLEYYLNDALVSRTVVCACDLGHAARVRCSVPPTSESLFEMTLPQGQGQGNLASSQDLNPEYQEYQELGLSPAGNSPSGVPAGTGNPWPGSLEWLLHMQMSCGVGGVGGGRGGGGGEDGEGGEDGGGGDGDGDGDGDAGGGMGRRRGRGLGR